MQAGKAEADANPVLSNQTQQEGEEAAEVRRMRRRFERVHVKAPVPSLRELEEREAALAELVRRPPNGRLRLLCAHYCVLFVMTMQKKKEKVDFINTNAWEVINKSPRKLGDDAYRKDRTRHPSYGRIPKYLLDRKELWAQEEEERRLNAPDPDCPPGMVLLDEEERQRTLRVLAASLEEARARMNRLPLRVETLSQVRRKNELEEKLHEIEDAIKVFDRTKVYVAKPPTIDEQQGDKSKLKSRLRRNSTAGSVRSRVSAAA